MKPRDRYSCGRCGRQVLVRQVAGLDDVVGVVRVGTLRKEQAAGLVLYKETPAARVVEPVQFAAAWPSAGRPDRRGPFLASHGEVCRRGSL